MAQPTNGSADPHPASRGTDVPPSRVGKMAGALGVIGAVGGFGLWVWFVIENGGRVWARVTSFAPGPGRASKLEVGWMLVGWAMGPVFALLILGAIGAWIDSVILRLRTPRGSRAKGPS